MKLELWPCRFKFMTLEKREQVLYGFGFGLFTVLQALSVVAWWFV